MHLLTTSDYDEQADFGGRVYKIRHDGAGVRMTFIKASSGKLKVREELCYPIGEDRVCEKVNRSLIFNGSKSLSVDQVSAGDLFAVIGLTAAEAGQGLGAYSDKLVYDMVPTLKSRVIFPEALNVKDVLKAFRVLNAEDPSLNVVWEESLQEIHIHVMGLIQLEVLEELVRDRFQLQVTFGVPRDFV